jgi:hypothetical protein
VVFVKNAAATDEPPVDLSPTFDLDLPSSVWRGPVADYRDMLKFSTEASDAYHLFTFMGCAGSLIGRSAYLEYGVRLYGNLYICLVGRTGQDRKSTSLRYADRLTRDVDLSWRVLRGLSSAEGLMAQIQDPWVKRDKRGDVIDQGGTEDKRLMVWLGELSSLLRKAKQERVSNIVPLLTEAFDSPPALDLPTRADPITVTEPHISLLSASTPSWLEDLGDREVLGGFANRFVFILGPAKSPIPFPDPPDPNIRSKVIGNLAATMQWLDEGVELILDPGARDVWEDFYTTWHKREWPDELVSAVLQRVPDVALKIAIIYAVLERTHTICPKILNAAIDAAGHVVASAERIFAGFHENKEVKLEKRILTVLSKEDMNYGALHRAVGGRHTTKTLSSVLDALVKSGQTWERLEGRRKTYGVAR